MAVRYVETYHVQTVDTFLQRNPSCKPIVDSRTRNELVRISQHIPQLLDSSHSPRPMACSICQTHFLNHKVLTLSVFEFQLPGGTKL